MMCDVLHDDSYGSHLSGPYARQNAMNMKGRNLK